MPIYKSFARSNQAIHLLREDSHQESTLNKLQYILKNQKIDFLFIDGDHRYEGVKTDFEMYFPLVRSGGLIALHDIVHHKGRKDVQVDRFWNEIKSNYKYDEFISDPAQRKFGIGLMQNP